MTELIRQIRTDMHFGTAWHSSAQRGTAHICLAHVVQARCPCASPVSSCYSLSSGRVTVSCCIRLSRLGFTSFSAGLAQRGVVPIFLCWRGYLPHRLGLHCPPPSGGSWSHHKPSPTESGSALHCGQNPRKAPILPTWVWLHICHNRVVAGAMGLFPRDPP